MPIDVRRDDIQIALNELKAKENIFVLMEKMNKLGSWELDLATGKATWSAQNYINYGYEPYSVEPGLKFFLSHLLPKDVIVAQEKLQEIISTGQTKTFQGQLRDANGAFKDVLLHGQAIYDNERTPIKIIGTTQDVTELLSLKKQTEELSQLIEFSSNEIYIVDMNTLKYLYVNNGACDALGYSKDELLEMSIYDVNPELNETIVSRLKKKLIRETKLINKTRHKRKDGSTYHAQAYIHPLEYNSTEAYVIFDTDISKSVEDEAKLKSQSLELRHLAHHDNLTGLPNRTLFKDRLAQAIISAKRRKTRFALLFIDLDQFKKINDTLGHHIGDKVLVEVALRLQNRIREEDTIARLGGDEFTIILKDLRSLQDVSNIAQKIVDDMREPISILGHILYISSSIGISLYPQDSSSEDDLIKFADTAMYKAKDEGRNNFQFYAPAMTAFAFEKVVMDASLRIAIKEEQFLVYFQPQIDIKTDVITGMEALVRWAHPNLGIVPPSKFIPIAEESGLIIDIDKIVMKKAMRQFVQWREDGLNPGVLALNLSMKQLNEKNFTTQLQETMNDLNFQPSWLELEVTEGQVMNNPELSIQKLKELSDIGVEIAIDDFGTGYSSLSYLKKLPLDKLKIDQSFVRDIPDDEDDMAITKAIIALGKSLNFKLIAEGVETSEQKEFLSQNGCQFMQGYLYSRPLAADEITILLKKRTGEESSET